MSDADTQFGDDEYNFYLFSRLEESQAELENEMGCDKFIKVYKTVQVMLLNFKNLSGEINDMCVFVLKIGDGIIIMDLKVIWNKFLVK